MTLPTQDLPFTRFYRQDQASLEVFVCFFEDFVSEQALLASSGLTYVGGAGQQRLAARLITKFAQYFPSDFERSVQVLTVLTKSAAAETARSSTASATLQDALKGLGATTAELCKLSPDHDTLQQTTELLFRYSLK